MQTMTRGQAEANLETARAYLRALEENRLDDVRALFTDDIVQVEHPNRLKPNGDRRGAAQMAADGRRGVQILQRQTYEVLSAVAQGDRVALEVKWTGVLAIPLGELKPGDAMTCWSGIFLDFRDGLIVGQRNHDCFAPF
jgi:ketosteroid isomerase-like protein